MNQQSTLAELNRTLIKSRKPARRAVAAQLHQACERLEERRLLASWTPLTNLAPSTLGTMVLLTDGTIMASGNGGNAGNPLWYKLTPSANGNYATGTWTTLAAEPVSRLYTATNVLQDGRVFNLGGEYVNGGGATWNNTGDIYNPVTNSWTNITAHPEVQYGDVPSMLLDDGRIITGSLTTNKTWIYNPATNAWVAGPNKLNNDRSDEETWVKTADNQILSYNIFGSPMSAQKLNLATNTWIAAGSTSPNQLQTNPGSELGPALRIPDGRVVQIGGTNHNSIYNPATNTWANLPDTPGSIGANDAPGAILPDGRILYVAGDISTSFNPPTSFFIMDPIANSVSAINGPTGTPTLNISPFTTRMLVLPTGQVLFARNTSQLYIYNPDGAPADSSKPVIGNITSNGAGTYTLTGSQLNGISAGASYGDDAEMDSNYPIIRLTNAAGSVFYAKSFGWNKTGVGVTNGATSVNFTLPAAIANGGTFKVEVSGAGVNSKPVLAVFMGSTTGTSVTVQTDPGNAANIQSVSSDGTRSFSESQFVSGLIIGTASNENITIDHNFNNLPINVDADGGTDTVLAQGNGANSLITIVNTAGGDFIGVNNDGVGTADATFSGSGNALQEIDINTGGTLTASAGTVNVSVFNLSGGTLTGTSQFNVNSSMSWTGGTMSGSGTTVIAAAATMTDSALGTSRSTRPLQIDGFGSVAAGNSRLLVLSALTLNGTLDMNDNDMILDYPVSGPQIGTITSKIVSARSGGTWLGTGLTSTSARNASPKITTLGAMEATDYKSINPGATTFDGEPIDNTAVLVKYTYYGDANFNGKVQGDDYAHIDSTFNQEHTAGNIGGWINGDWDYNGKVDGADYANIDAAFNGQGAVVLRPSYLPPTKPGKPANGGVGSAGTKK